MQSSYELVKNEIHFNGPDRLQMESETRSVGRRIDAKKSSKTIKKARK